MSSAWLPAVDVSLAAYGTICEIKQGRERMLFAMFNNERRRWWRSEPRYSKEEAERLLPRYILALAEQHRATDEKVARDLQAIAHAAIDLVDNATMEVSAADFAVIRDHWRRHQ